MLNLYNVASREKEVFKPNKQPNVTMYSCGPTVYGYQHIGNYSMYAATDILYRSLEYLGYNVKWVMNITDVGHMTNDEDTADSSGEDKLEKASKKEGKTPIEIAEFYTEDFFKHYDELHLKRPQIISKATEHIQQMIEMIEKLIENGVAYKADDGIYFSVANYKKYGDFSKVPMDEIMSGARIEVNENKKDPRDFALWVKCVGKHENHTMKWDSPWGLGFPGWHIECSAMSTHYLGYNIDIHTGGVDHLFPHHECEIAQSEGALPAKNWKLPHHKKKYFVKYWFHKNHIKIEGEKMSKSKGNVYTPKDIIEKGYSYRELRYAYVSVHYRTEQNFTFDALVQAKSSLSRIDETIEKLENHPGLQSGTSEQARGGLSKEWDDYIQEINAKFIEFLEDDLNIPGCLSVIFELIKEVNKKFETKEINEKEAKFTLDWLKSIDSVLGIMPWDWNTTITIPEEIIEIAEQRYIAKMNKDFDLADSLRAKAKDKGYEIIDTQKVKYKIKKL